MFRLKILLLSVLLSGLVLVGLGLYSLTVMNKVGLDRIDREILTLGEGHLAVGPPRDYWQNFEKSLRLIYREEQSDYLVIRITDRRHEVLFRSAHWPVEITTAAFPDFDRVMETRPPVPVKRDSRPGPPPMAYEVCRGKSAGMPAQFQNPQGETVAGICENEGGTLVLRRTAPRSDRQRMERGGGEPDNRPDTSPSDTNRPERSMPRIKRPYFATIETSTGVWRTGIMGSERITMMVGVNMARLSEDASRYRRALLGIVPIALLLLAAGGWVIAQRALKPVSLIVRTSEGITARGLDRRIPAISANSELSRLVKVINEMLDRLEKSFGQAHRFSADAAHELQTPLTIIQGELDNAVQHAPVGSEEQQLYSGLLEEVQRLKSIIQKLLILARVDAGRLDLQYEAVDLSGLIEDAVEDAGAMAPHLRVEEQIAPGITISADRDLMGQVVGNLTSNAVKYNREGGLIRFQLSVHDREARLVISNTGVPIPAAEREKIFDRFYRVDQSRSKTIPGSGLGLSLAQEIVRVHRGDLRLDEEAGDIISFTMTLPCISC